MKKQTEPTFDIDFRKQYPTLKENHNGVDVELTAEEYEAKITEWEENQAKAKAIYEAEQAKAIAKTALLSKLGITAEEAVLLLS
jgi:hypothetical protein